MNAATLSRIRVKIGTPSEIIEEMKGVNYRLRLPDLYDTAYYLAENDPQEFYTMRLWGNLREIPDVDTIRQAYPQFAKIRSKAQLQEQQIYKLTWEYRRIEANPVVSTLRLVFFPKDFPQDLLKESADRVRQLMLNDPRVLGSWVGYSLEAESLVRLHRIDWVNQLDPINFFYSAPFQAIYTRLISEGATSINATMTLRGIIKSELLDKDNRSKERVSKKN